MNFKEFIKIDEGILKNTFNLFVKKLNFLFNNIKSFVLRSKKVKPGVVSFDFPNFKINKHLNENIFNNFIIRNKISDVDDERIGSRTPTRVPVQKVQQRTTTLSSYADKIKKIQELLQKTDNEELIKKYNIDYLSKLNTRQLISIIKSLEKPLEIEKINHVMAGLLFELEVYMAIRNQGFKDIQEFNEPIYYSRYKILLKNFYQEIKKQAEELASLIIEESKKSMPCVDAVLFSGGIGGGKERKDTADIKLVCKDSFQKDNIGYSIKRKTSTKREITLGTFTKNPIEKFKNNEQIEEINTPELFAKFLNKMINEGKKTRLVIGGIKTKTLQELLEEDFYTDPENPFEFLPKPGSVHVKKQDNAVIFSFRKTKLKIKLKKYYQVILINNNI